MRLSPATALVAIATAVFFPFVVAAFKLLISGAHPPPPPPGDQSDPVYFTVVTLYKIVEYIVTFLTNPYGIAIILSLTLIYYILGGK